MPKIIKRLKTKHHRIGADVIKKLDELKGISMSDRIQNIKRDMAVIIDETDKIKSMSPIIDDIFNMEDAKFKAEKAAFDVLNNNLRSEKPNPKYVVMVAASQFKKSKVVLNLNVENMTPHELIEFMVKAKSSKGEV